jgi:hypothetical protein
VKNLPFFSTTGDLMSVGRNYFEMQREYDRVNELNDRLTRMAYEAPDPKLTETTDRLKKGCLNHPIVCISTVSGTVIGIIGGAAGGGVGAFPGGILGCMTGYLIGCCIARCIDGKDNSSNHKVQKKQIIKERS